MVENDKSIRSLFKQCISRPEKKIVGVKETEENTPLKIGKCRQEPQQSSLKNQATGTV